MSDRYDREQVSDRMLRRRRASAAMSPFAFLLPIAATLLVFLFAGIYPFGTLTLVNDSNALWLEKLGALRRLLLGEGGVLYSFGGSMGEDFLMQIGYMLASPVNLIAAAFPESGLSDAFALITIVKLGLAGLSSYVLINRLCPNRAELALGLSCAYSGCGCLMLAVYAPSVIDCAVLLPLVAAGVLILLEEGRAVLLILSLCAFMLCCWSLWPCAVLFALAIFVWGSIICRNGESGARSALILVFSVIIAIGCASVFIFPSLVSGSETLTIIRQFSDIPTVSITSLVSGLFMGAGVRGEVSAPLFCSAFVLLLLPVYFFNSRLERSERQLGFFTLVFIIATMLIPALCFIWVGMSVPVGVETSCSFVLVAYCLCLASRGLSRPSGMSVGQSVASWGLTALLYVLACLLSGTTDAVLIIFCAAFLTLYAAILMLIMAQHQPNAFLGILVMLCIFGESIAGGVFNINASNESFPLLTREEYVNASSAQQSVTSLITGNEVRKGSNDFYRVRGASQTIDALDLNALPQVRSTRFTAAGTGTLLEQLGISGEYGYTPMSSALLSVRYILSDKTLEQGSLIPLSLGENLAIYEDGSALAVGMAAGIETTTLNLGDTNALEAQNRLVSAIIGDRREVFVPAVLLGCSGTGVHVLDGLDGLEATRYEENATVDFSLITQSDGQLYMHLQSGLSDYAVIYVNGSVLYDGTAPVLGAVVDLGTFKQGSEVYVSIVMREERASLDAAAFASANADTVAAVLDELSRKQMTFVTQTGSSIRGMVECAQDEILMTTIPWQSGWKITVDGAQTEGICLFGAFLGVPVGAGRHSVTLTYSPDSALVGLVASVIFLLLALVFCIFLERRRYIDSLPEPEDPVTVPDADVEPLVPLVTSDAPPIYNEPIEADLDFESDEYNSDWL